MREACLRIRESDDSCDDPSAGVRGERDDELTEAVLRLLRVIESGQAVEAFEEIVDERRDAHEVFAARPGDEDVLRPQLEHLIVALEKLAPQIPRVAEPARR